MFSGNVSLRLVIYRLFIILLLAASCTHSTMVQHRGINSISKLDLPFCSKQVNAFIETLTSQQNWKKDWTAEGEPLVYRTPTKKFGEWLLIYIYKEKIQSKQLSSSRVIHTTWHKNECKKGIKKTQSLLPLKMRGKFTDNDLQRIIKKNKMGIIYLWSPGMVYSHTNAKTFIDAAKDLGLQFTSVMGAGKQSELSKKFMKKKSKKLSTRRLSSIELTMRGGRSHFPKTFFYKNGKIHPLPIVGAMTKDILIGEILQRSSDL